MSIGQHSPAADMTPIKDVVRLLQDTPYEPSRSTVMRWVRNHHLQTERQGGNVCVRFTDIMDIHADYVHSHPKLLN